MRALTFANASHQNTPSTSSPRHRQNIVVVTGGAGFIGHHLCLAAAKDARVARVVCVDDFDRHGPYPVTWKEQNASALTRAGVDVVRVDACDEDKLAHCLRSSARALGSARELDARVIHLASRSGIAAAESDVVGAVRANVLTTAAVLAVARKMNEEKSSLVRVPRVVVASSGSVYGDQNVHSIMSPKASFVDDDSDEYTSTYAATKGASEGLVRAAFANGMNTDASAVCARIFTVYGPRGRPDMAIWRFIEQLHAGKRVTKFGDGRSTFRDYVYVDDACEALMKCAFAELATSPYAVVNVAGGRAMYLDDVIRACERACGVTGAVDEFPGRPGDVGGTYGDVASALATIDWAPKTSLSEGLRRTVEWWRSSDADGYRDPSA